jgi:hypothetical protein
MNRVKESLRGDRRVERRAVAPAQHGDYSIHLRAHGGKLPIIGVGGIFNAEHAWEKIQAGASLVQCYSGLVYEGPSIARNIVRGLVDRLDGRGVVVDFPSGGSFTGTGCGLRGLKVSNNQQMDSSETDWEVSAEPQQFGPYMLHELINRGGMSEIWYATNPENQPVAIRRLHSVGHVRFHDEEPVCAWGEGSVADS